MQATVQACRHFAKEAYWEDVFGHYHVLQPGWTPIHILGDSLPQFCMEATARDNAETLAERYQIVCLEGGQMFQSALQQAEGTQSKEQASCTVQLQLPSSKDIQTCWLTGFG